MGNTTLNPVLYAKVLGASGGGGSVPTALAHALLDWCAHTAFTDQNGQTYYDNLLNALYSVESIAAVYTQSGAVYSDDSLDSLKDDLVVTATYDNGTTAVVPASGYTLSGTLTVGTSTITVSYAGKTTTFSVTVTERYIPKEYQQVAWVGMETRDSASNTCYIETFVTPTGTTGIVARIAATNPATPANLFGIRTAQSGSDNAFLIQEYSADQKFGYARFGSSVKTAALDTNFHDFVLTTQEVSVDGTDYELAAPASGQSVSGATLRIFGVYAYVSDTLKWFDGATQKVAYFKILDGETTVKEYVPCYRKSDNVIGFYERVGKTFSTNGGSGTLTKGANVV